MNTNVKDILKKFEHMSANENGGCGDLPKTPVAPARRLKTRTSNSFVKSNSITLRSSFSEKVTQNQIHSSKPAPKRPISVKERSKMFESNNESSCDRPVTPLNGVNKPSHLSRTFSGPEKDRIEPSPVLPPVKPPRTFTSIEKGNLNSAFEGNSRVNGSKNEEVPQVPLSKKKTFCNYFKTLSNAALKKSPNVFVDLTPTTVSPPKHYGTLKRSHSEEHIYAEPYAGGKGSSPSRKESEPLHYMCTPLIKPKVPERIYESNVSNRKVVRNLIYNSFASLRSMPKEDQESKVPNLEPSDSDVSMKAIQDRIIYVKSIRQVSGSSLCIAPKLYEALYIITVSEGQPELSHSFPLKVPEEFRYPLLQNICFPDPKLYKATTVYQSETFNFTLLNKGERIQGYCLRIMGYAENDTNPLFVKLPVAICILSKFNAPLFYRKILSEIEKHLSLPREKCFKYIRSLLKLGVPNAGASLSISDYTESSDRVVISRPLDSHIVGFEMTRALQLLDIDILVKAVASLLLERRVLFFSSNLSNLYQCCKAVVSLLYPFEWPHTLVPLLPPCLVVHCCSELPYVIGLHSANSQSVLELMAEHELLIIDIDKGAIVKACNDEDTILPRKIQKAVLTALNLAKNMTDPTEMMRDVMISEAFVHMFVEMIGHYENHFQDQNGELTFQKEAFLKNAFSYSIHTFLQWFTETQMFDSFITESTWRAQYRTICQDHTRTFFEKRVDEYKWELAHNGEKISRFIEKTVRNFGEMIMHKLKK